MPLGEQGGWGWAGGEARRQGGARVVVGALHDMPGPDMAPRPRAVTPAETSPSPPQFVHLTLQLAHDRCLFPRTGFPPRSDASEPRARSASGTGVCPPSCSLEVCDYTSDTFHIRSHRIRSPLSFRVCVCVCVRDRRVVCLQRGSTWCIRSLAQRGHELG